MILHAKDDTVVSYQLADRVCMAETKIYRVDCYLTLLNLL